VLRREPLSRSWFSHVTGLRLGSSASKANAHPNSLCAALTDLIVDVDLDIELMHIDHCEGDMLSESASSR
jgi:hypothetical protein